MLVSHHKQIRMLGEGQAALDAMVDARAVLEAEEAFGSAFAGQELMVALVDVGGDELGALCIGAGDENRRNVR